MFEYLAKRAKQREPPVAEERSAVGGAAASPGRRESAAGVPERPGWRDVTAADINDYLREVSGGDYTAKDFRTWHATVLAAVGLAVSESATGHEATRKRALARVVREVADPQTPCYLGNTPAVARASYIDPRVIQLYEDGHTIASVLGDLDGRAISAISPPGGTPRGRW